MKYVETVDLAVNNTFVIKDTPIMFCFQHFVSLVHDIISVSRTPTPLKPFLVKK